MKRAKEIDIFDANGNKWEGSKGIVNEADELDRFAIVGEGYKIAQHEEVIGMINQSLTDLNLDNKMAIEEMNEGARLRVNLNFPQVYHTIAEERVILWATFDNSYDSSTGLRLEINAKIEHSSNCLYVSEAICEQLNRHYHRHTKGLNVEELEGTVQKGIEIFQNEIGKEFQKLADTPIKGIEAKLWIEKLLSSKKKSKVAKKYLECIKEAIDKNDSKLNSAWALYSLISSILTKDIPSVDLRRNNARELLREVKNYGWGVMVGTAEVPPMYPLMLVS